ncbi:centromere protein W [Exaiptasia diaphana]|uniref:Centromere protein W n=1 Tax=Exaiptasia diaphana TaxID=2652724 RepID=A0A913Y7D5_EXADI|nr:centromere protein W [Exaiptasia diaphana]KXJ21836.1 Centromere protein W [Exaiptasia diaphana]
MKRNFPRAKQKAIIKKFQKKARLAKSTDILIFLDYMMFLRKLAIESSTKATEQKSKAIQADHVKDVLKSTLKKCRG